MDGYHSLTHEDKLCNIFMFVVPFKNPYLQKNKRSTSLPVDYITHGTHYPQNVIQIGTLKKSEFRWIHTD